MPRRAPKVFVRQHPLGYAEIRTLLRVERVHDDGKTAAYTVTIHLPEGGLLAARVRKVRRGVETPDVYVSFVTAQGERLLENVGHSEWESIVGRAVPATPRSPRKRVGGTSPPATQPGILPECGPQ